MAMDFFEHQDQARKATKRLALLMSLAVLVITVLVYLVVMIALVMLGVFTDPNSNEPTPLTLSMLFDWRIGSLVFLGVVSMVTLGSLYKLGQLRQGGEYVAAMLGGRLIPQGTRDPDERKILNVVEEMAIASGVPVPPVYLLENESGINAFAAGYSPDNAVIGVTRGAVTLLDRDELQGVMGHEFSHILSGDMRINLRMIGILHGILLIALLGLGIMRALFYSGGSRRRSSNSKDSGGGVIVILGLAIALTVIGYVGVFFGKMIKAAISRQREYLADAAAVQFTRNPQGIGGALVKIGGYSKGTKITDSHAEEASHMFFASGVSSWLGQSLSTHPPLPRRISRIMPDWDGSFIQSDDSAVLRAMQRTDQAQASGDAQAKPDGPPPGSMAERIQRARDAQRRGDTRGAADAMGLPGVTGSVGQPTGQHLAMAAVLLAGLDDQVHEAAGEPFAAQAVIYALLIDPDDAQVRQVQMQRLTDNAPKGMDRETAKLSTSISALPGQSRLPLVERCLGALRELTDQQFEQFVENVKFLVAADKRQSLFEWSLRRMISHSREPDAGTPGRSTRLASQVEHARVLLSALALAGHKDADKASQAFDAAWSHVGLPTQTISDASQCNLSSLESAIDQLKTLTGMDKKRLVAGMAESVSHDGKLSANEGDLLRVTAMLLGVPMPPLTVDDDQGDAAAT